MAPPPDRPAGPSRLARSLRQALNRATAVRRALVRLPRQPRWALLYLAYLRAVGRRDWPVVLDSLRRLAPLQHRPRDLVEFAEAAQRLGDASLAVDYTRRWLAARAEPGRPVWDGAATAGPVLIRLKERRQGIAHGIQAFSFVMAAARRIGEPVILTDPRLVPLYRRALPDARVIVPDEDPGIRDRMPVAALPDLVALIGEAVRTDRSRLQPDPALREALRARYRADGRPVVGLAWSSPHKAKGLPALEDWARLIAALDVTWVSLQFRPDPAELAAFERLAGRPVRVDDTVDQGASLDDFAAQVAAMDAVVSISNTTAHTAGALGVPLVVLRDDDFAWIWPVNGAPSLWYDDLTVVTTAGRPWRGAIDDAAGLLARRLGLRRS